MAVIVLMDDNLDKKKKHSSINQSLPADLFSVNSPRCMSASEHRRFDFLAVASPLGASSLLQ
jgi:hypothetical protein